MNTEARSAPPLSQEAATNIGWPERSPPGPRHYKLTVRLSAAENAAIKLRAIQMGMRTAPFIRQAALSCPAPPLLQGEQHPPAPGRPLLGPVALPNQLPHTTTLVGFFFVLVLFLLMALLVSTEAEGTDAAPLTEEDVSAAPPEIPEVIDEDFDEATPPEISEVIDEDFGEPTHPELPEAIDEPYAVPYFVPPAARRRVPPSIFDLEKQISDLDTDIFIMSLSACGAVALLFLVIILRGTAHPPPREYLREREIEVLLASLERQVAALIRADRVIAYPPHPRAD